jgi:hypothetical protein
MSKYFRSADSVVQSYRLNELRVGAFRAAQPRKTFLLVEKARTIKAPDRKRQTRRRTVDRTKLREILVEYFSESDLRNLCFQFDVDYADLGRGGRADKARELVIYFHQRRRLHALVEEGKKLRPDVPWEDAPDQQQADVDLLRSLLTEERRNLLLIEDKMAKYVLETDIPLVLIKEERAKRKKIAELEARLAKLRAAP